jgi:hypothetical protein
MPSPREVNVRQGACHRANQEGRRGQDFADDEATKRVADGTGHHPPYAVFKLPVKRRVIKTCDLGPKQAKVVRSPKVLKTGVNSPVTARIYA